MKIFEATSPINGKIVVKWDFAFGKYIQVNGLTQSGGILKEIWQETLKKIKDRKVKNVLILGLGGGSVATVSHEYWPEVKITGVDIDPVIIDVGKKYLGLGKMPVEIHIQDAYEFVNKLREKYDMVLVDLYIGEKFSEKFADEKFLHGVKNLVNKEGVAIFNRLYGAKNRSETMKFGRKLEKEFTQVEYFYPQANVMFIVSD